MTPPAELSLSLSTGGGGAAPGIFASDNGITLGEVGSKL